MLRTLGPLSALVAIVFLGIHMSAQSESTRSPSLATGTTATDRICAAGCVEGITEEIELRPRVSEKVVELLVKEGQRVEQDAVLLKLDSRRQRYQVTLASSAVKLAQRELERLKNGARAEERKEVEALYRAKLAELEHAQMTWQRTKKLRGERVVTKQLADDHEGRVKSLVAEGRAARARADLISAPARPDVLRIAEAKVEAAQAKLALAKIELEDTWLRAPRSGQVLQLNTEVGEMAGTDSSDPALVMADTSQFRVKAFIEELDAPRVKVGMLAEIRADGLTGRTFQGHVIELSPQMSRKQLWTDEPTERYDTKTREVLIELDDAANLVVGLRVDVVIDVSSNGTSETVPGSCQSATGDL